MNRGWGVATPGPHANRGLSRHILVPFHIQGYNRASSKRWIEIIMVHESHELSEILCIANIVGLTRIENGTSFDLDLAACPKNSEV